MRRKTSNKRCLRIEQKITGIDKKTQTRRRKQRRNSVQEMLEIELSVKVKVHVASCWQFKFKSMLFLGDMMNYIIILRLELVKIGELI